MKSITRGAPNAPNTSANHAQENSAIVAFNNAAIANQPDNTNDTGGAQGGGDVIFHNLATFHSVVNSA